MDKDLNIGDTAKVKRDGIIEELTVLYVWKNGLFLCNDNEIYTEDELVDVIEEKAQSKKLDEFSKSQQDILLMCSEGVSKQFVMNKAKYFYETYDLNKIRLEHEFKDLYSEGWLYKILNKYKSNIQSDIVFKV